VDRIGPRETKQYFSIAQTYSSAEIGAPVLSEADTQHLIRAALLDSVRHHLVADVPVGAFLSSGIDSGALVALMRDAGQEDIQTVTLAFEEFRGSHEDEAPLAAQIAARYGTRHTTRVVTEQEFREDLPKIFDAMDQPTIDGLNTWFVSKAGRELGLKVAISGLGGDELFGGYPSFYDIPLWVSALALPARIPLIGELARRLLIGINTFSHFTNPKAAGLLKYGGNYPGAYLLRRGLFMPWELSAVLGKDIVRRGLQRLNPIKHVQSVLRPGPSTNFGKVAVLESSLYMRNQLLRDTDWASMAHSLEVRVPLVDVDLLRRLASTVTKSKWASKRMLGSSPTLPLPANVIERSKTGFVTPVQAWLQRDARLQRWRQVSAFAADQCAWSRRWAFEVAAA
jgi:asparagine synthase (glutamine-hydrolysing)